MPRTAHTIAKNHKTSELHKIFSDISQYAKRDAQALISHLMDKGYTATDIVNAINPYLLPHQRFSSKSVLYGKYDMRIKAENEPTDKA